MGVMESLQAAMVKAAADSDTALKAAIDARGAKRNSEISQKMLPVQARTLIDDELARRTQSENSRSASSGAPGGGGGVPDMQPMPANVSGGDRATIQSVGPSQPPQTVPTPAEEQRPGYTATTRAHRMGVMFPWQRAKYKNVTNYDKDEPSVNTHSAGLANAYEGVARGDPGSTKVLIDAVKSAQAELGPFAGEAIAEGKSQAIRLRNDRIQVENAQREQTFETMTSKGYSPGLSLKYSQAKTLGEKSTLLRESGELATGEEADRLLIQIRNHELSMRRRADLASEDVQRQKQMELQERGLVGFLGLRATPEEVGQTLTEAQNAFKKVMDAGGGEGGGVLQAMLPQIQGNISKLSGDDWLLTKEPGIGEDRYKPYKTNEILIKFAEADGRWVEKGLNREEALEKRRKAASWLEKIHGISTHDEQIVDGRLEFSWGHPEGPNAVRLNELMNTQRDHENLELQHGMAVRDFAPSAYRLAIRKEPDLGDPTTDEGFASEGEVKYMYPHFPPEIKQTLDKKERLRQGLKTFIYGDSERGK